MKQVNYSGGDKVLLTGISGFIASALAQEAVKRGFKVAGLVRQSTRQNEAINSLRGKITLYQGDLKDYYGIRNIIRDFKPDYVFHLGAITPVSYSFEHPIEVTETNYLGTINLVEALKAENVPLKRFIFASSMEVYGYQDDRNPFSEEREPHPMCPYAVAKLACEKYLQYNWNAYKFPAIAFRQTNCYGRKENDYFVVEAIVTQMLKNDKEINLGNPEPVRNLLYIDDLVELYFQAMMAEGIEGQVFNTGPANGITIKTLAEMIAEQLNWKGKINWYTRESRAGEIFYLNSLPDKATRLIGWSPKVSLVDGLNKVIKHWQTKI